MDPERLLQQAQAALERGASPAEVNARLQEASGGQFRNIAALHQAVQFADAPRGVREAAQAITDDLLNLGQGLTFGFADEAVGAVSRLFGRPEVGERFAERTREAQERVGTGRRMLGEVAGGAATGGLAARAGKGLLARAGVGPMQTTTPGRTLARNVGLAGAIGGTGGAVAGAGFAEEGQKVPGAITGGLIGLSAGVGGVGLISGAQQVPRAFQSARQVGQNLADHLRATTGRGRQPTSALREGQREVQRAARAEHIRPLEALGETPPDVTGALLGDAGDEVSRTMERYLRSSQTANPNARKVLRDLQEVRRIQQEEIAAGGARRSLADIAEDVGGIEQISFSTADEITRNMTRAARQARTMGRAEETEALTATFEVLDEQLRTLPGFSEFKDVWARTSANMRALSNGYKRAGPASPGMNADDVLSEVQALRTADERAFYLDGWANRLTSNLERRIGSTGDVNNILYAGRDFDQKLRQLFPSDESFQQFQRAADIELASIRFAERAKVVAGAIAFIGGGTSLLARVLPTPGQP
jgi:hypothetical protein